jgi:hypothetical protein
VLRRSDKAATLACPAAGALHLKVPGVSAIVFTKGSIVTGQYTGGNGGVINVM